MDFSLGNLISRLWKKQGSVLGIDIGTSSIKIVQLKKEKERAILETYGEIAIGPYANLNIGQAAKLPEKTIVEALKDVLRESNAAATNAAVSIPLKSSFVTVISVPTFGDKNIDEMIQLEARRYVPVPISEVSLDWWALPEKREEENGDENKRKFTDVLLVAIHNNVISSYRNIIDKAGLRAKIYEVENFSTVRASVGRENAPVAVVDIGASGVKLAIIDYGVIRASYSVSKGSQDLTLALSHSLSVDFAKAEELKRSVGLSDLPEHKEVVSVMGPILDYVFSEVNIVLKDFQRKHERAVGKVILTGGGALLKNLVDYSVKKLAVNVELARPFSKVEYPMFLADALKGAGASFTTALGLAIRAL